MANVFGAKVQLNTLNNEIEEKQKIVGNLEAQRASIQNEIAELQRKRNETKIALNSKSVIEVLKEYQKKGSPVVAFSDNQIAVNPNLAAKVGKLKELPQKFQVLSPDSWIVFDRGLPNKTEYATSDVEAMKEAVSSQNPVFVIRATGEEKRVEKLTNSEAEFLKNLIQNSTKSEK